MTDRPSPAVASTSRKTLDEPSTDAHQALLTEHFGFHPRVFVDALVYAANEHMYSIGGQFEEFAKKQLKVSSRRAAKRQKEYEREKGGGGAGRSKASAKDVSFALANMTPTQLEAEAESGVHSVLTLMENTLDHIFDLLELYCLKTVFGIKPSQVGAITLKHHRGLDLRSAEERVQSGEALTSDAEGETLVQREAELREKVDNAKRMRHALHIANVAAQSSLNRSRRVSDIFADIIAPGQRNEDTSTDALPLLNANTPQLAHKLRVDAQALIQAIRTLTDVDPLGASLIQSDSRRSLSDADKRSLLDASGATDKDRRAWERGREAYINWEMDRIIRNVRNHGTATGDSGDHSKAALPASPFKPSVRVQDGTSIGNSSAVKRRRTTAARMSSAADRTEGDHQAAQIGEVAEVEGLASVIGKQY